jgi:protein SCO1
MLKRHSAKIVDAVILLASAIAVLGIAWAESRLPAADDSGPNFGLIGPDNRTYTRASFPPDTVLVMYFGFTTCWRACPTALNAIAQAVENLGDAGNRVQPIFVSLDPQREDPETVGLYLEGFGDRFIGLRGSEDQLRAAASTFGVSVRRIRYSADPTDYTMVHSSPVIVLVPRKPNPIILKPDSSAEAIRAVLESALECDAASKMVGPQSASRSAFAATRSAVPKPSVNRA